MIRKPKFWIGAALGLVSGLIVTTVLLAGSGVAEAHSVTYDYAHDCGTYTLKINLLADANDPQSHRVIVTENDVVIAQRDVIGVDADFADFLTVGGSLGAPMVYRTYVFDQVNGGFVYNEALNTFFRSGVNDGQNGQIASTPFTINNPNTCTPIPTATAVPPTATPVPPTPTQSPVDRCLAIGGIWTAQGCQAPTVAPVATVTPVPTVITGHISAPDTGDAGLKR